MLAISDRCDEIGFGSYQAVETIAKKAKMSERNARRVVTELEGRGKLKRHDRPGRTTEIQIVIPDDFGRRRRADKLSGVGADKSSGVSHGEGTSERADNLAGVEAGADNLAGAPDNLAGGADNLAADSSLPIHSSYSKEEDARARDGLEAVPLTPEEQRELRTLDYEAARLTTSKRSAHETFAHYRKRISDLVTEELRWRQRTLRDRDAEIDQRELESEADEATV